MSTFNNQWVLSRSRARWRRRAPAVGSGAREPPPAPLPQESHERHPSGTHERSRPAFSGPVRKHPRWIDRDT